MNNNQENKKVDKQTTWQQDLYIAFNQLFCTKKISSLIIGIIIFIIFNMVLNDLSFIQKGNEIFFESSPTLKNLNLFSYFIRIISALMFLVFIYALSRAKETKLMNRAFKELKMTDDGTKNGNPPIYIKTRYGITGRTKVMHFLANGTTEEICKKEKGLKRISDKIYKPVVDIEEKDFELLMYYKDRISINKPIHWQDKYLKQEDFNLVLGANFKNEFETINLNDIPHMIIGGGTGSGKTVLARGLALQCLLKGADLYIADLKRGVDFKNAWKKKCTFANNENEILKLTDGLVKILNERMDLLSNHDLENISLYNATKQKEIDKLKRIILLFDEIAQISIKTKDKQRQEITDKIIANLGQIATLGRFAGIHLILSTQRPDSDVIPGQIKSTINFTICGRANKVLSKIILDNEDGANEIPKRAKGLFITNEGNKFQGYLYNELEILSKVKDKEHNYIDLQ